MLLTFLMTVNTALAKAPDNSGAATLCPTGQVFATTEVILPAWYELVESLGDNGTIYGKTESAIQQLAKDARKRRYAERGVNAVVSIRLSRRMLALARPSDPWGEGLLVKWVALSKADADKIRPNGACYGD